MGQARRYAILIGSSQFPEEPKLTTLRCPENDVDGMHRIVSAAEWGVFTETVALKNAKHYTIENQIEETLSEAGYEDQVLIYYSGHGLTDLLGRLYLTATNTIRKKLVGTSIAAETLRTLVGLSACKSVILILDCCFGGAAGKAFANVKSSVIDEQLQSLSRGSGIYLLTASAIEGTALEKEGDQYSLLTKHIINGITSGEAAGRGAELISIEDIYSYVHRQMIAESRQEPMRWALNVRGEELIIARKAKAKPQPDRLQQIEAAVLGGVPRLPRRVQIRVQEILDECRAPFSFHESSLRLLEDLFSSKLEMGDFIDGWEQIEAAATKPEHKPEPTTSEQPLKTEPKPNPPAHKTPLTPEAEAKLFRIDIPVPQRKSVSKETTIERQPKTQLQPNPPAHKTPSAPEAEPKPGRIVIPKPLTESLNGVPLEMLLVPAGKFTMGATKYDWEKPLHAVTLQSFYMGKSPVTQKQWQALMYKNDSHFKGDDLPVEGVSWHAAKAFCKKLSQLTGHSYRLPSEAEWEYACRAGTTGDYAGNLNEMAWYANNSGKAILDANEISEAKRDWERFSKRISDNNCCTHPVGQKKPNAFGLYDMHGNVWEWCEDVWHDNYEGAPKDGSAWMTGGNQDRRITRGGSWHIYEDLCCSAYRGDFSPANTLSYVGLRVVVSPLDFVAF